MNDELDDLLNESLKRLDDDKRVADARRKVGRLSKEDPQREALLADIRHYDDTRLWDTIQNVAVIRERKCACGHVERWMDGWFKKQAHRHIGQTTRLVAGAAPGMKATVEYHKAADVQWCSSCVAQRVGEMTQ